MTYNNIEDAASALGVSVRQCFRYMKTGRIFKTPDGSFEIADLPDTDVIPRHKPISVNTDRGKSHVINSLQSELAASRLQFQIEQAQASRMAWHTRQDAERKAEAEKAALMQAAKLKIASQHKTEKLKIAKMQRLKSEILSETAREIIPSGIQAEITLDIAKLAGESEFLSYEDLLCIATANRDKILAKNYDVVTEAFRSYGRNLLLAKWQEIASSIKALAAK